MLMGLGTAVAAGDNPFPCALPLREQTQTHLKSGHSA